MNIVANSGRRHCAGGNQTYAAAHVIVTTTTLKIL